MKSTPVQNISTKLLQDFAILSDVNIEANILLNDSNDDVPIFQRDPKKIIGTIDDGNKQRAAEWRMPLHEVEAMVGSASTFSDPVCGLSANNIMKLFLDSEDKNYCYAETVNLDLSVTKETLNSLPDDKHFLVRVQGEGLGHVYIVDLPASDDKARPAFLYQSDLGDGVTRTVSLTDWMREKAHIPIDMNEIYAHFDNMASGNIDLECIAKLFDIDGNPLILRAERMRFGKPSSFQVKEYDPHRLQRNVESIFTLCNQTRPASIFAPS
ncbi:MAG: cycle-inhibiting factor [Pseudomonas sp.]|uniref:cycle-inhibiting factor n=1 Tax=Pseudomonas sp. TaxID=306 RepID=UPI003D6F9AD5